MRRTELAAVALSVAVHAPLAVALHRPVTVVATESAASAAVPPGAVTLVEPPPGLEPPSSRKDRARPRAPAAPASERRASRAGPLTRARATTGARSAQAGIRLELGAAGKGLELGAAGKGLATGDSGALRLETDAARGANESSQSPAAPSRASPLDETRADVPPRRAGGTEPVYPALEALDGREGTVELRLLVRADGSVARAEVVAVSGAPVFGEAAREAALGWRFEPARKDGRAVDCVCVQRLAFELGRSR